MILLFFAGGMNAYNAANITPVGTLIKQVNRNLSGTITPTGLRVNILYVVPPQTGTITPAGTVIRVSSKLLAASMTPAGTTAMQHRPSAVFQSDMNVGFFFSLVQDTSFQADEDVILPTAVPSRDGLLQTDEDMRVKSVSVTSY